MLTCHSTSTTHVVAICSVLEQGEPIVFRDPAHSLATEHLRSESSICLLEGSKLEWHYSVLASFTSFVSLGPSMSIRVSSDSRLKMFLREGPRDMQEASTESRRHQEARIQSNISSTLTWRGQRTQSPRRRLLPWVEHWSKRRWFHKSRRVSFLCINLDHQLHWIHPKHLILHRIRGFVFCMLVILAPKPIRYDRYPTLIWRCFDLIVAQSPLDFKFVGGLT